MCFLPWHIVACRQQHLVKLDGVVEIPIKIDGLSVGSHTTPLVVAVTEGELG
jgi:hypothetical protein